MIFKGDIELTVDDPAYALQLADHRKYEIREFLVKRLTSGVIAK